MVFYCEQCGECCSIMGEVLSVIEEYGDYRFLLVNKYTGEKNRVEVDLDKRALFMDEDSLPAACSFLRHRDTVGYCTVHRTRPEMCRDFGCWRLLILDPSGKRAGRVMQARFFSPESPALALLWEERIRTLDEREDEDWDREVIAILSREGYSVIR
ncbi:MAG: YkgJ family cysteine cluster protein [Methanoregulaceae archaeon]|nr:YkgJ family cysteine cluster protein [Methanoregulaceae archaeon]